jgi:cell division protein FtsW (lipid II flippase)
MTFLFNLIFFIMALGLVFWLIVLVAGIVMAQYVKRRVNKFHRQFEKYYDAQSAANGNAYRTTQTSDGISVEDRRPKEEARQKIFAPDEGEYVEYTED